MAARRSVWSDDAVQALAARFVPAADDVGRLQGGGDAECVLFQQFAEQGHYRGRTQPSDTRQGTYAVAPSGAFLGSINTRSATEMQQMLESALAAWDRLPPEQRRLTPEQAAALRQVARPRERYPADGLVLEVVTRDLGEPTCDDWRAHAWNRDWAWFSLEEARAFVPLLPRVGERMAVPQGLVRRLACTHLVDDVRGQVSRFRPEDVEFARLEVEVTAFRGDLVTLRLRGASRTSARGRWPVNDFADAVAPAQQERGFAAELQGSAQFDRAERRFVAFELVAKGERWGGTQFNERADDLGRSPIGVVFRLAPPSSPRVSPGALRAVAPTLPERARPAPPRPAPPNARAGRRR